MNAQRTQRCPSDSIFQRPVLLLLLLISQMVCAPTALATDSVKPALKTGQPIRYSALLKDLIRNPIVVIMKEQRDENGWFETLSQGNLTFVPIYTTKDIFMIEVWGNGLRHRGKAVILDGNTFAHLLIGNEKLILDHGTKTPVQFDASEMKAFIDHQRQPEDSARIIEEPYDLHLYRISCRAISMIDPTASIPNQLPAKIRFALGFGSPPTATESAEEINSQNRSETKPARWYVSTEILESSGNDAWDDAARRALEKLAETASGLPSVLFSFDGRALAQFNITMNHEDTRSEICKAVDSPKLFITLFLGRRP